MQTRMASCHLRYDEGWGGWEGMEGIKGRKREEEGGERDWCTYINFS